MAVRPVIKTISLIFFLAFTALGSKAQLNANFSATPTSGCTPLVVNFTDLSTGSPTQWRWDLGNGTISFLQNPSATYFTPGNYNIKLVITNAAGTEDSITKNQYITVNAPPVVGFTGTPLIGCYPLPVQFTDQSIASSGTITTWQWDFGDGAFSAIQNPTHTYTTAGSFNVSLRVTNSAGCIATLTKPLYIQTNTGVHADFTNTAPASCNPPAIINFQNLSTGTGILNYQWSFGDGGSSILVNPSHSYNTAGTYSVTLIVTNSTGCSDTITKNNIIVIGTVDASFTSADSVCVNSGLTFTNTSTPAPSGAFWDFGDGTTSNSINPVKAYAAAGTYLVRMIASFGACTDSAFKTITVVQKPTALFIASPLTSCAAPLTVNFTNQSTGGGSFNWNFGDGGTSTLPNPTHTYTTTGSFTVTLTVTNAFGCSDTYQRTGYVTIQAPQATITGLPDKGCAPLTHNFNAIINTLDPVVSYFWDFGDGTTSNAISPTHTFPAGVYNITLIIVTATGCTDTVVVTGGIMAGIKPVANLVATPLDVCAHLPVFFTDLSTGTITQWLWNFGDGGTAIDQNPTHIYEDTGYFTIQLIVWNNGCADTVTFVNYIHINPPVANFSIVSSCAAPKTKDFVDNSIGADEWNWDFGDGTTSTVQSPSHTYAATGLYLVTLTVRNFTTGCEYTKQQATNVIIEKANFSASDTVICRNSNVLFSSLGTNPANVTSYSWNFGDGSTGSGITANHVYTLAGIYNVQLIVLDIAGCPDTLLKPLYIRVDGPTAAFTPSIPGSCLMSSITFNDNSTDDGTHPIAKWIWNFGDGTIDTLTAPPFQHSYAAPGTYAVSLKIIDSKGCIDSIVQSSAMTITKPVANFATPDTLTCPNQTVAFSNTSTGLAPNYLWDFGDGATSVTANPVHTYTANGLYTIKLIAYDQNGCTDTITKPAYVSVVSPQANFTISDSLSTCPPLIVSFTNTSLNFVSVNWNFGDGTSTQSDNPSHFYSSAGVFNVVLTVTGPGGCTNSFTKPIVVRGPLGSFTYSPLNGCNPLFVNLTATTQDRVSFIWDYNDGNTLATTDSVLTHSYTIPGIYIPKMILVDAGGCQVAITGPDTIRVTGVNAKYGLNTNTLCDAGFVNFSDSSFANDPIVSYAWNFGDGATSTLQNPTHYYAASGLYNTSLVVTTQAGCIDTVQNPAPVKIVASPQADIATTPNGCAPLSVTFNGSLLVADTSAMSWDWVFGNGNTSNVQNPPSQVYTIANTYNIQLIATNSSGCKDTVTKSIDAFLVPTVSAGQDTMICKGIGTTLSAAGANNYNWSPSLGLSCTNCANPVATPDSVTNYIVTGTTLQGCSNKDTVQVKVNYPFTMINSTGDTLCKGGSVRLFASGATTYLWSPSTGLSSTTSQTPLASPATTTTYSVVGSDNVGCFKDTGYVQVKVYPIPVVDAGQDQTINVGQTVDLIPTISPDVTNVLWTPTGSIFRNNYPSITVKPRETTTYTIEARNPGGCKTRDQVTIYVICNNANVFIPNTFSPNGDGVNDIFYPRGTGLFSIKTLRIFSRWGEIMYEKNAFMPNDASAGWDGTFKGIKLTPDVYVYTIDIVCENSSILTFKGNVALIK